MQKTNLQELYPDIYKKDTYLEVTDEVQAVFLADKPADPGRNPGGQAAPRSALRCGDGAAGQAGQVDLCPVLLRHDRQRNCPGRSC